MKSNNNAAPATYSGNDTENRNKYNNFPVKLSFHQKRVYDLLSDGVHRSAADITNALGLSDPRSVIRDLRDKGVPISDEWCDAVHGGRFKRYFIHGDNAGKEVRNE